MMAKERGVQSLNLEEEINDRLSYLDRFDIQNAAIGQNDSLIFSKPNIKTHKNVISSLCRFSVSHALFVCYNNP